MKIFAPIALLVGALALSGCNAVDNINSVTGALSSPQATQAAANLKAGAQAIVCAVNGASAAYNQIAIAIKEGKAAINDANNILTVTTVLCKSLGGVPSGVATVPLQ
jgi:Ca2+/Na+ antiporter